MIGVSFPVRNPSLLSPRTASYVAALIQEGDEFDYCTWLERVRAEERRARQAQSKSGKLACGELGRRSNVPEPRDVWLTHAPATTGTTPIAIWRSRHKTEVETPEVRLTQRLEKICDAWIEFQSSRARDAVYGYLESVFTIVEHYKVGRKTRRLLQYAFDFADLPFNKSPDPFTAIIRCTSDDSVDSKMISKWARALRYVARSKRPTMPLEKFVKRVGGINACAALYARYFGRGG